jgi:hypothetical protein
VAVYRSWHTADGLYIIDRVVDEPGVAYRIWREGGPAGEIRDDLVALYRWLTERHVELRHLVPLAEDDDPFCE